ncbi:MAG: lipase/acyltransferase domain-containing protein, partial [Gammaproteobacteria bacterium]
FGRDFYRSLLDTLETAGGYRRGSTDAPVAGSGLTYYVYEYDWRLDMAASVRGLHELIERVAEIHGDAGQKVDILAHSSGGLLARYYARYGATDLLGESSSAPDDPGSHHIRRLLLVGTPNLGTMQAVLSLFRGEEVGLRHIPEEVVATCPSVAQLMPDPGEKCLLDLQGDPLDLDLYDIESWRELRWALFSDEARDRVRRRHGSSTSAATYLEVLEAYMAEQLTRGRRFHELLAAPLEPEEPRPFVFGGDCTPTLSHLVVSHERGEYRGYENPKRIPRSAGTIDFAALMNEPGDGNVTRSSLMGRMSADDLGAEELGVAHAVFSCSSHKTLMAHPGFQDNLLYALLEHEQERAP